MTNPRDSTFTGAAREAHSEQRIEENVYSSFNLDSKMNDAERKQHMDDFLDDLDLGWVFLFRIFYLKINLSLNSFKIDSIPYYLKKSMSPFLSLTHCVNHNFRA